MKKSHHTRLLSLILALVVSVSLCVPAFAAEAGGFTDVAASAWYYGDVTECAALGIVAGYEDGSFLPDDNVTGIQFLTMLTRTFYAGELGQITVPASQPWYYPNTKVAADIGLSKDLADADINDTEGMTRYNMAIVLYNTLMANNKNINAIKRQAAIAAITDYSSIPAANRDSVINCYAQGIITGMSDGSFSGEQSMTRAQACAVIMRMLKLINNYNPGDTDNDVYDDGTSQNPSTGTTPDTDTGTTTSNGTLANGQPATPENVTAILNQLRVEYPVGSEWGPKTYYRERSIELQYASSAIGNTGSLTAGCGGFAALVSDRIFGHNAGTEVTNIADVRPGDVMVIYNSDGRSAHISIVEYTVAPDTGNNPNKDYWYVYTANGNSNGGYISWDGVYCVIGCGKDNADPYDGAYYRFITRY